MKPKLFFVILFLLAFNICKAQDSIIVLDTSMFDYFQTIKITNFDGWIFKEGSDTNWAQKEIDTTGWKKFKPAELTIKNANKSGKAEGWFRLRFKLDSSFSNVPLTLNLFRWMAMDVYIDGSYVASSGNTGINGKPYKETTYSFTNVPLVPLSLRPGIVYIMAVHFVDYVSPINPQVLKSGIDGGTVGVAFAGPEFQYKSRDAQHVSAFTTLSITICIVLALLFWFLYFQNASEKVLRLTALSMSFLALSVFLIDIDSFGIKTSSFVYGLIFYGRNIMDGLVIAVNSFIVTTVFKRKTNLLFIVSIILLSIYPFISFYFFLPPSADVIHRLFVLVVFGYVIIASWKNLKGAQWAVVSGVAATFVFTALFFIDGYMHYWAFPFPFGYLLLGGEYLSFGISLMMYVAMRFKEILTEVEINAKQVVRMSEEKREILANQNALLERQVEERTKELKASQAQLIQSEKMASLGELTAGIAHEIQNPLNFVNNFSEVNKEMLEELKAERLKPKAEQDGQVQDEIINDVVANEQKINHHGKRADAIVKSMLEHSRAGTGEKEATDINKLADEYLRLAYQGMRAKDNAFNTEIITSFDETIGNINIVPQDIGRVLLNLYNNAFYAVNERQKVEGVGFKPAVSVTTKKVNGRIEISVADNGNGIPEKIKEKIFQPFFTTKPTGSGTGLGLSLSYDIVKAHGGEIKVDSKEGEGSEFVIELPFTMNY